MDLGLALIVLFALFALAIALVVFAARELRAQLRDDALFDWLDD